MAGKLLLARHHQSEYNKLGLWTGLHNPSLDEYGRSKAEEMGSLIEDMPIHHAFASKLARSIETLGHILRVASQSEIPIEHADALNERDYGIYTGKNKWEIEKEIGTAQFRSLRRSWNHPIPDGETLKMVYERTIPFYLERIVPHVHEQKNILVVAHGNSLRAIVKHIESISDEDIAGVEVPFGAITFYSIDMNGRMLAKEVRATDSEVPA